MYKRQAINNLLYRKISHTDVRKGWWVDENLHSDNLASLNWGDAIGDEIATLAIPDVKVPFIPYTNVKFAQYGGVGNDCLLYTSRFYMLDTASFYSILLNS